MTDDDFLAVAGVHANGIFSESTFVCSQLIWNPLHNVHNSCGGVDKGLHNHKADVTTESHFGAFCLKVNFLYGQTSH